MRFILIMSTLGRVAEIDAFLASLSAQTARDVRLYLCDQNTDGRLDAVVAAWSRRLAIQVVRSERGLSRGRNVALRAAMADLEPDVDPRDVCVVFPDDDCWYEDPELLAKASAALQSEPSLDGLTIRSLDERGQPSAASSPDRAVDLNPNNIFVGSMAISYAIFLRLGFVRAVGEFDETLGVGAGTPWGAGEESDYLIRGLKQGFRLRYFAHMQVRHPRKDAVSDAGRFLSYAQGHGRVLRKNGYSFLFFAREIAVALAAFVVRSLGRRRLMTPYLVRAWGYARGYSANPQP